MASKMRRKAKIYANAPHCSKTN